MKSEDIIDFDPSDPDFLKLMGIDPIPDYEDLDSEEKYSLLKDFYVQCLIKAAILESQRSELFEILSQLYTL